MLVHYFDICLKVLGKIKKISCGEPVYSLTQSKAIPLRV
jgi:hypothetical protein